MRVPQSPNHFNHFSQKLPSSVTSAAMWGRTLITMPKFRERNYTYEQALRMALGGNGELIGYLGVIQEKYDPGFRRRGSRTQAEDFAGYLMRYRVRIIKLATYSGFNRELR